MEHIEDVRCVDAPPQIRRWVSACIHASPQALLNGMHEDRNGDQGRCITARVSTLASLN